MTSSPSVRPVSPPAVHIQANLEDALVQEALKTVSGTCVPPQNTLPHSVPSPTVCVPPSMTGLSPQGVDLRQYSKQVELELQEVERASIRDCILLLGEWGGGCHGMGGDTVSPVSPACPQRVPDPPWQTSRRARTSPRCTTRSPLATPSWR